jgi:predicted ATPase/class 3 adenylate cyclase
MKCQFCDFPRTQADALFCTNCGARLTPEVKSSVISDRLKFLGGELRLLSVFFVNFTGLDSLLGQPTYSSVMIYIRDYLNEIEKIIKGYDGTANQIVPDCRILGIFGAPKAHLDDNLRTMRCVLEIRKWWLKKKEENKVIQDIDIAIGVNTGRAFFGYVLEESTFLTVIGDTINTASRLADICPPHEILISESTYNKVQDLVEASHLGERSVKGKTAKINIYLVKDLKEEKVSARQKYPIFGREAELARLLNIAQSAKEGKMSFCIIGGQMGIGKSRLKEEFEKCLADDPDLHFYETHCSMEVQSPYYPFKLLLRKFFDVTDYDTKEKINQKIDDFYGRSDLPPSDARGVKHLLLTDLRRLRGDEIQTVNEEIYGSIQNLLRKECRVKPLVLIFEEFNRADPMSKDLVIYLLSEFAREPLMFLMVNVSRDYLTHFPVPIEELNLTPLSQKDTNNLITFILAEADEKLVEFIYRAAGGNPLFTIETIRNTRRTKVIKEISGRWVLEKEQKLPFLDDLYSVVMSTIDSLPLDYRLVIDYASVIGYSFNSRILDGLLERPNLKDQLSYLVTEGYIVQGNDGQDPQYVFRHNLLKDAAYTVLPVKKRKEIHQQTASLYERLYGDQLGNYYEEIGHHYLTCENFKKASTFFKLAGDKAKNLYALDQAFYFYDTVLKIQKDAETQVAADLFREVLLSLTDLYEITSDIQKMEKTAERGLDSSRQDRDRETELLFLERNGFARVLLNKFNEAEEMLLGALEAAGKERPNLVSVLYADLGVLYLNKYEYEKSVLNYNLSWNTARSNRLPDSEILCLYNLAILHKQLGNYEQSLEYLNYGLENILPRENLRRITQFQHLVAEIYYELWNITKAKTLFQETLAMTEAAGIVETSVKSALSLAVLNALQGDSVKAAEFLEGVDKKIPFFARENLMLDINLKKAYVYFYNNDPRSADFIANILRTAQKYGKKDVEFHCHYLLAQLNPDEEPAHARSALETAETIKLLPLIANALLLMAQLGRKNNEPDKAMYYGLKALHLYDEIKSKLSNENAQFYMRRPEYMKLLET